MTEIQTVTTTQVSVKQCASPGCAMYFQEGQGRVADVKTLYQQLRDGAVNKKFPLTHEEVLSKEVCPMCAHSRYFKTHNIRMYPTSGTLGLMERWVQENAAYQERNNLALAIANQDRGFVNQTIAAAKPREKKHKHGKRLPAAVRRQLAMEPKKFKEPVKKGKKKNQDDDGKKHKGR